MYLSSWYLVCTKVIFISKGSYGCGEPTNVIYFAVQKPYRPVRAYKLHSFVQRRIGPTMDFWGNSGVPIVMVPSLHQDNIYIKRKLRVWRAQKCILFRGAKTVPISTGLQTTQFRTTPYKTDNGFLGRFGCTYRHGTMFAPR